MHIHLRFDHAKLLHRAQRGTPFIFEIAWEHDGKCYPASHWADFGLVVLVWWLRAAAELAEGAQKSEFLFMDGPYGFEAHGQESSKLVTLCPRNQSWEWVIPLATIARELIQAANAVSRELQGAGIDASGIQSLEYGVARLRKAIFARS